MNRKQPPHLNKTTEDSSIKDDCRSRQLLQHDFSASRAAGWREQLISRRRLLIAAAGSVSLLFTSLSDADNRKNDRFDNKREETNGDETAAETKTDIWSTLDVLQQHLFPTELNSPGAHEINAIGYLKFIVSEHTQDKNEREFILKGTEWLDDMSHQIMKKTFLSLDERQRETVLKRIVKSQAGENWLSTVLLYITEALLADPVYGGNSHEAGWRWLDHTAGYPRPPSDRKYTDLLAYRFSEKIK